jgi:hypothetical protein
MGLLKAHHLVLAAACWMSKAQQLHTPLAHCLSVGLRTALLSCPRTDCNLYINRMPHDAGLFKA